MRTARVQHVQALLARRSFFGRCSSADMDIKPFFEGLIGLRLIELMTDDRSSD
jgi:hypothetical protein